MAGKRRKSQEMELLNRPQLLLAINKMNSPRNKALASFIYLSGCRISEIVGHKKVFKDGKVLEIAPLKKESIEVLDQDDLIIIHNVPCLKHKRNLPRRNIPIVISQEQEFVSLFMEHYISIPPEQPLFPMTRQRAWQILNDYLGVYTHFLIHERCTHLVTRKNFTDMDLKQFRGWASTAVAAEYTHLNFRDIANKMR